MIEGIFGKKIGMTHIFSDDGTQVPVTVIQTEPCFVVQRKTSERDGYEAVKLGAGEKREKNTSMPMRGVFKKAGTPNLYHLAELGCDPDDKYRPGETVKCSDVFEVGDMVDVSGRSKGKGFQGAVKRWGFSGGPASHGSMHNRGPGSIGQSSYPSRVFKGMKMAGHMGDATVTVQNLKIVDIKPDENILLVMGAVPGPVNSYMLIKRSLKKGIKRTPEKKEGEEKAI
ncbi:MAG TPA: 50S ribosomal protein L3 [Thermodesulfobacteriota bacterium]|nr:50S ribosomal protein L3 [Thermodesulfobacteriota bacterium]